MARQLGDTNQESSAEEVPEYYSGTVKWFNPFHPNGGRGYITPDDPELLPEEALGKDGDVFVFFDDIAVHGYKGLFSGNRVEFELRASVRDAKLLQAANVVILSTLDITD